MIKFWNSIFNWKPKEKITNQLLKRVTLTNKLGVGFTIAVLIYLPLLAQIHPLVGWITLGVAINYIFSIILTRSGSYTFSRFMIILNLNAVITGYSIMLGKNSGSSLLLFVSIALPLVLFQLEDKLQIIIGIFLSFIGFAVVEVFSSFPEAILFKLEPQQNSILYMTMFPISMLLVIFVVLYFYLGNERSERALGKVNEKMEVAYKTLEERQNVIEDNLEYAQRLQRSILPATAQLAQCVQEHFVIWRPKDVVGGDFYWAHKDEQQKIVALAVVDCTGHGVPGAFMSMLGGSLLRMFVSSQQVELPGKTLDCMHLEIQQALKQQENTISKNDGMVASLSYWNPQKNEITFAGTKQFIVVANHDGIEVIKGDNKTLGGLQKKIKPPCQNHTIQVRSGTTLYLTTDGLIDQAGDYENSFVEKFGSKRFLQWIEKNHKLDLSQQKKMLTDIINNLIQTAPQLDDITVMAFRPIGS